MKIADKFYSFLGAVYKNRVNRVTKAKETKELTQLEVDRLALYKQLKELYEFVRWINTKALPNRHSKKAFWICVAKGQPLVENMIDDLAKKLSLRLEDMAKIIEKKGVATKGVVAK